MRRTPGKAAEFASKVPGGNCVGYDDINTFLAHSGLDAVYVSTRPGTHLEICQKVAESGLACYVEKPVGRCAAETEEITNIFSKAGLPLYTAYISRAYDRTQMTKKMLKEGTIGDRIHKVTYKLVGNGGARDMDGDLPWRLDPSQSGGGLIMDVGCHVLDRIDYLVGPFMDVKGSALRKNLNKTDVHVENYVRIEAKLGDGKKVGLPFKTDGALVECEWDFSGTSPDEVDELIFEGSKGRIKMAGMSFTAPLEVYDLDGVLVEQHTFNQPQHTGQQLIQAVNDDMRGIDQKDYISFGENAVRTSRVLDSALSPFYGGRSVGFWERNMKLA